MQRSVHRNRLLSGVVSIALVVAGMFVPAGTADASRTPLPVFGTDVVLFDGFDGSHGWNAVRVGDGTVCANCSGPPGDPAGYLGVETGWVALELTVDIPAGPGGHPYESCTLSVNVSGNDRTKARLVLAAIDPSSWQYLGHTMRIFPPGVAWVAFDSNAFAPNPRRFVARIAMEDDPAISAPFAADQGVVVDDFVISCFYFFYP